VSTPSRAPVEVVAALFVRQGRVFLARRAPGQRHAGKWEFPGGKIEVGESPAAALARELHEELGVEAEVGELVAETVHEYAHFTIRLMALRVLSWKGELRLHKHDRFAWVLPGDLAAFDLSDADVAIARELSLDD
jgi:8-oxo-dGTP diphosphatase